ncbi:hypothetical protein [Pseudonocardia nigra]|uniref:hypothetical protein n=1 Tax=Pseudonocardia nigra TaxID=1921578 RepID=UPI001FEB4D9D|nr:hypothetical protein [Pseudonocardia nigra]
MTGQLPADAVIDGRVFAGVSNSADGDVDARTRFHYRQDGDTVWADYHGGAVARGFLVGTRSGAELRFRYVHLDADGRTASGRCTSQIVVGSDGLLELHEDWAWKSQPGAARSVVAEVAG